MDRKVKRRSKANNKQRDSEEAVKRSLGKAVEGMSQAEGGLFRLVRVQRERAVGGVARIGGKMPRCIQTSVRAAHKSKEMICRNDGVRPQLVVRGSQKLKGPKRQVAGLIKGRQSAQAT